MERQKIRAAISCEKLRAYSSGVAPEVNMEQNVNESGVFGFTPEQEIPIIDLTQCTEEHVNKVQNPRKRRHS